MGTASIRSGATTTLVALAAMLTGVYHGIWTVSGTDFGWTAYTPLASVPPRGSANLLSLPDLSIAGDGRPGTITVWALAALVLGCAGAVVLLRRGR